MNPRPIKFWTLVRETTLLVVWFLCLLPIIADIWSPIVIATIALNWFWED